MHDDDANPYLAPQKDGPRESTDGISSGPSGPDYAGFDFSIPLLAMLFVAATTWLAFSLVEANQVVESQNVANRSIWFHPEVTGSGAISLAIALLLSLRLAFWWATDSKRSEIESSSTSN